MAKARAIRIVLPLTLCLASNVAQANCSDARLPKATNRSRLILPQRLPQEWHGFREARRQIITRTDRRGGGQSPVILISFEKPILAFRCTAAFGIRRV